MDKFDKEEWAKNERTLALIRGLEESMATRRQALIDVCKISSDPRVTWLHARFTAYNELVTALKAGKIK